MIRKVQGRWLVDTYVRLPDGSAQRIRKFSDINTERAARAYEAEIHAKALAGEYRAEEVEVPTLETFAKPFLTAIRVNQKASVLRSYKDSIRLHLLSRFGSLRLDEIGFEHFEQLKQELLDAGLAKKTIQNQIGVLSSMLRFAVASGKLKALPPIRWMKLPKHRDEPALTEAEFWRLHDAADPEWWLMLRFAVFTGLRIGELCELQWSDLDLLEGWVHVRRAVYRGKVDDPKHSKQRTVPIEDPDLLGLLQKNHRLGALQGHKFVFSEPDGTQLKPYGRPSKAIARAARKAQLGRFVGWHLLRHTWATWLARRGVGGPALMKLGGWADLSQVQRYVNLHEEDLRTAIGRLGTTTKNGRADEQ